MLSLLGLAAAPGSFPPVANAERAIPAIKKRTKNFLNFIFPPELKNYLLYNRKPEIYQPTPQARTFGPAGYG
jgi:hypothetical protein